MFLWRNAHKNLYIWAYLIMSFGVEVGPLLFHLLSWVRKKIRQAQLWSFLIIYFIGAQPWFSFFFLPLSPTLSFLSNGDQMFLWKNAHKNLYIWAYLIMSFGVEVDPFSSICWVGLGKKLDKPNFHPF